MNKVYCVNCKHFRYLTNCTEKKIETESWFIKTTKCEDARIKNKNNDCAVYKPKSINIFKNFFKLNP